MLKVLPLPKPGELLFLDFRSPQARAAAGAAAAARSGGPETSSMSWPAPPSSSAPLRLVQWNIERGYQLQVRQLAVLCSAGSFLTDRV